MTSVTDLHAEAMDLVERGILQRLRGDATAESELVRQALDLELAAIRALKEPVEPTFSVLHRSAGTLALRCGDYRLAERMASKALAEDPPREIAKELRDLVQQAQLQRHLDRKGIESEPSDLPRKRCGLDPAARSEKSDA